MAVASEGVEKDFANENATKVVWALAWPAVALNGLQIINNLLDTGFVGRLDSSSITAQGASIPIIFMLFQITMSLGTAATAIVSRSFGAGEICEARYANLQCLSLSVVIGLALMGVCTLMGLFVPYLLIPNHEDGAMKAMTRYVVVFGFALPAQHIIQVFAGSLRGVGDTKSPMVISGFQILLHMVLNFLLIFPSRATRFGFDIPGADLGLAGAGAAFALSSWISAILYLAYGRRTLFGSLWKFPRATMQWAARIIRIAYPAALMGVVRTLALGVFVFVLNFVPHASSAVAAIRGGFTIESIMFMPGFGLSMAAAALVGQSLGMKRPDRAAKLGWTAGHYSALVVICLSIPIAIFADDISRLLIQNDREIAREIAMMIRFLCITEFLFGYSIVLSGALQGAGDTMSPMWISLATLWAGRLPLALLLAVTLKFGSTGAWASMAITQAIAGIWTMWTFHRGRWKLVKV